MKRQYTPSIGQADATTTRLSFVNRFDAFQRLIDDYAYSLNAIEAYHGLAEAYHTWAEKDGDISKYQSVIDIVEQAEKKYERSDDTKVNDWMGCMQVIKQKAVEKLQMTDEEPPDPPAPPSPDDLVQQGLEHCNRGELEAAKRKAIEALDLDPNHSPANELLSKIVEKTLRPRT